jgi:hypothetical protein
MRKTLRFKALDGEDVAFPVPKGVNPYLAQRAIEKVHRGGDEAAVMFGLTHDETAFVAEVIAKLEAHRPKAAAV